MPESPPKATCDDCSSILPRDLNWWNSSIPDFKHRVHKLTLKDLQASAITCESCAVMERSLRSAYNLDPNNTQHTLTAKSGPVVLEGDAGAPDPGHALSLDTLLSRDPDGKEWLPTLSTILVHCGPFRSNLNVFSPDPNSRVVAGNKIAADATTSYQFIQDRLSICDNEHSEHCLRLISLDPKDRHVPPPRLYNIREKRIQSFIHEKCIHCPPNDDEICINSPPNVPYIALSYMWGDEATKDIIKSISTVQENITARQVPDTFDLYTTKDCPLAYRSAIDITLGLKISYIWIDSICMIQRDKADRMLHFQKFNKGVGQIYQNARLTICATGGDATWDMLGPRQLPDVKDMAEIPIDGGQVGIAANAKHLHEHLAVKDGWDTRAWAFQEWLLSPRLAYFTKSQVFFECRTLFEEGGGTNNGSDQNVRYQLRSGGETDRKLELQIGVSGMPEPWDGVDLEKMVELQIGVDGMPEPWDGVDKEKMVEIWDGADEEQMLELWDTIVIQYSGRVLSYGSDRLNGIRSVGMQLVKRIMAKRSEKTGKDIKFCSGLLSERLHVGLLWQISSHASSECITAKEWGKYEVVPPSWSWACWTGGITWEYHVRKPTSRIEVSSIDENHVVLAKPELLDCGIGKSLDLQTYVAEIGPKTTCFHGSNTTTTWSCMLALLHPKDGSIIGRASFDEANSEETSVECLVVSYNPSTSLPLDETESINVLLISKKEYGSGYIRLGVGEIFVRTGKGLASLPDRRELDSLVLV